MTIRVSLEKTIWEPVYVFAGDEPTNEFLNIEDDDDDYTVYIGNYY